MNIPQFPRTLLLRQYRPKHLYEHCWYCGVKLTRALEDRKKPNYRTRDHVEPKWKFPKGHNHSYNVVFACKWCNDHKRGMTLEEWRNCVERPHRGTLFWAERLEEKLRVKHPAAPTVALTV